MSVPKYVRDDIRKHSRLGVTLAEYFHHVIEYGGNTNWGKYAMKYPEKVAVAWIIVRTEDNNNRRK